MSDELVAFVRARLDEAAAKAWRRIVDLHADQHDCATPDGAAWPYTGCTTLRLIALPYADHPDYREEWRP